MTRMQDITPDLYREAMTNGYQQDIGQLTPHDKKLWTQKIRRGEAAKCRALWPNLLSGTVEKTTYVNLVASEKGRGCDGR